MHLLDTDTMTLLERAGPDAISLKARLAAVPPDDLATTIISYSPYAGEQFVAPD